MANKEKSLMVLIDSFAKKHNLSEKAKAELKKLTTIAYAKGSNSILNLFD